MLFRPEQIFGWGTTSYIIMAVVAVLAFVLTYFIKHRRVSHCILAVLLGLIVLSEITLSLTLGGTGLFFLEWIAFFGELLMFLPGFVGSLAGVLTRLIVTRRKHT